MLGSGARWLVAAVVLCGGMPACKKGGGKPPAGRDGGGIVATASDGAPLVATGWTAGVSQGTQDPTLRGCRVGLRTGWGPQNGTLSGLPMAIRTHRAHGSREEVLRFAREKVCQQVGIPAEQCTEDKFEPAYEHCDGDPRPPRQPLSPESQELAERIRSGASPADGGPGPASDADLPDRAMAPYGPDGEQMIY